MAVATQREIALQMLAQLRVLDPSVSADIGTPERKILDTVAQALAEAQIDLNALSSALDLDSKVGAALDRFLALFGFARQRATNATGVVTFSRTVAALSDIRVPAGTQLAAFVVSTDQGSVVFQTTVDIILPAGEVSVDTPVRATVPGSIGNVAAGTITTFVGSPTLGITAITNAARTTNGKDIETDDELKVRFRNTVFRNVSGTADQYLALAAALAYTTKANVIGPISRYREYMQVPNVDDTLSDTVEDTNGNEVLVGGGGSVGGEYTSALSTIPFSKHIYTTITTFLSNGDVGITTRYYQDGLDYRVNTSAALKNVGDTLRLSTVGAGPNPLTNASTFFEPNVTFLNVYTGGDTAVEAVRPSDVVLFEHSYLSAESRNDWDRNITNCVDVFIDGTNPTLATTVVAKPTTARKFVNNVTNMLHYENFRRVDEPETRPVLGNLFTGVSFQPLEDLPDTLTINGQSYEKGLHYWAVREVSALEGTTRARNGIEWSPTVRGRNLLGPDPAVGPFTGDKITLNAATSVTVTNYLYDANITDLQSAIEGSRQTTTDVLAHQAHLRWFKIDITVMYTPGSNASQVNSNVQDALSTFLAGQYFGTTIQLSDLLQIVHGVPGIDNVRWTHDVDNLKPKVIETDNFGDPLLGVQGDRVIAGDLLSAGVGHANVAEIQQFYLTGTPTGGTYTLVLGGLETATISYSASAATVLTALTNASFPIASVTGSGVPADPFVLTFSVNGWQTNVIKVGQNKLTGVPLNNDFFLRDNTLPRLAAQAIATDTVPGLIIRPRAQNTWSR